MSNFTRFLAAVSAALLLLTMASCVSTSSKFTQGKQDFLDGDYHQSFAELKPAAEQGNADAQYAIGYMYYYGLGARQDREAAFTWIRAAAAQGQPQARQALANMNQGGGTYSMQPLGTPYNYSRGSRYRRPIQTATPASASSNAHLSGSGSSVMTEDLKAAWPLPAADAAPAPAAVPAPAPAAVQPDYLQSSSARDLEETKLQVALVEPVAKSEKRYTVQVMASYDDQKLESFILKNHLENQAIVNRTDRNGRNWYVLTYGEFASPSQARATLAALPDSLRSYQPWVRSFDGIEQG